MVAGVRSPVRNETDPVTHGSNVWATVEKVPMEKGFTGGTDLPLGMLYASMETENCDGPDCPDARDQVIRT